MGGRARKKGKRTAFVVIHCQSVTATKRETRAIVQVSFLLMSHYVCFAGSHWILLWAMLSINLLCVCVFSSQWYKVQVVKSRCPRFKAKRAGTLYYQCQGLAPNTYCCLFRTFGHRHHLPLLSQLRAVLPTLWYHCTSTYSTYSTYSNTRTVLHSSLRCQK